MRKILKKLIGITIIPACIVFLIHLISAATLDRKIDFKEVVFRSDRISSDINGYRIAFISDTHYMPIDTLESVVRELNQRDIDLLVLGGDYRVTTECRDITFEMLSKVVTTDGIYGVEGNHDCHVELFETMERFDIRPLSNSGYRLREGLFLAGVEDMWNRSPDIRMAIECANADDFTLLISHNPDLTMRQNTASVDLVLSGHTHGGHITFFGLWAPYLTMRRSITDYGQRFRAGWAESRDGVPVFVSVGAGGFDLVPRVFARPEVVIFTLVSE